MRFGFEIKNLLFLQFSAIPWAVVEPLLLVLNLGTHGFYPFPGTFRRQYNMYVEYTSIIAEPRCYPGILHVYLVDILNFLINLIWLRIVVSYLGALYKVSNLKYIFYPQRNK